MTTFWRKVVVTLGYFAAGFIILAALLVSVTQVLDPLLNDHRPDFEKLAIRLLGRPVQIGHVDVAWDFYKPELVFQNVHVLDLQTQQPTIEIPFIKINIAIFSSLIHQKLVLDGLNIKGVHLTLRESQPGEVNVGGFYDFSLTDNMTGRSLNPNATLTWIFSQPKLVLQDFEVHYISQHVAEKYITLKWVALTNSSKQHRLSGKATLHQDIPTQIKIKFDWMGEVTDLSHVSADLYLYLQNVSLPQWFNQKTWNVLHFDQGIGTADISAKWKDNRWQKIQSTLEFYDIKAEFPKVFGNPLQFDQLTGLLDWQQDANGTWSLNAKNVQAINVDMNAAMAFSMNFPPSHSPDIQLTSQFTLKNAKNVSHYLPLKIFDPDLVIWLKNAFLGGQVVNGNAILQGQLSDFPFTDGKGKFEISGTIKDIELKYAPKWPLMQNANGKILFSGGSMTIDINTAEILDVPLTGVHAEISDLSHNPILNVKNMIQADLAEGLELIQESPLQQTIGKNLSALKLQGPMRLALSLAIPLNHPSDAKVQGNTTIANATLNLPDWNLTTDQLNGTFDFTEDSITASNMTGRVFGQPVTLNLATEHPANKTTYVTAVLQGAINTVDLQSWLKLPIEEVIQGTANYKTQLTLPSRDAPSEPTRVVIQSDLKGMVVRLPVEYGKKAESPADFNLSLDVKEHQPLKAKLIYNKLFSLAMTLTRAKQNFKLLSANLNLGQGSATWQTQPGIIITGKVDRIDWDKIAPHIAQFLSKNKNPNEKTHDFSIDPNLFRSMDIQTNEMDFSGFKLNNLKIQLSKSEDNFILGLTNSDMEGEITIPRAGLQQGIQAQFKRLNVSSQISSGGKNKIDPANFPPISFVGEDVRIGDMSLGRVTVNLEPTTGGAAVKQFDLESVSYKLHAVGMWSSTKSYLQGNVVTSNVSDFLKSIGFPSNNLIGSKGNADFDLNWSGGFFHPSVQELSGTISLKLNEGRIINLSDSTDAKMGLGRLLNIFSLQSLPRRLSLNFSDVFQKGYSFDSLTGDFTLRNGNATTQNTRFKGPVAGIQISGRIGLSAKDLDLKLSVTPYVTGSLPVVAAIAAANPVAGVATWVIDKMVSPAVSQMSTYNYSITGSWENPDWNQMSTQKSTQPNPVQQRGGTVPQ